MLWEKEERGCTKKKSCPSGRVKSVILPKQPNAASTSSFGMKVDSPMPRMKIRCGE